MKISIKKVKVETGEELPDLWTISFQYPGTSVSSYMMFSSQELAELRGLIDEVLHEEDPPTCADVEARMGVSGSKTATEEGLPYNPNHIYVCLDCGEQFSASIVRKLILQIKCPKCGSSNFKWNWPK